MTDPMTSTRPSDPAVNEATTKAGQAMESWLREPDDYEWGRKVTNAILAIEDEARRGAVERIRTAVSVMRTPAGRDIGYIQIGEQQFRSILEESEIAS